MSTVFRRAYLRYPLESSAQIAAGSQEDIPMLLTDISCRGAAGISNSPLEPSERVKLTLRANFLLKNDVKKNARIAWCRKLNHDSWMIGFDFGMDNLLSLSS